MDREQGESATNTMIFTSKWISNDLPNSAVCTTVLNTQNGILSLGGNEIFFC